MSISRIPHSARLLALLLAAALSACGGGGDSPPAAAVATNLAPVANAGPAQSVRVASTVALSAAGSSDANGDTLTYAWSLTAKPAGSSAALSAANLLNPTFVPDLAGSYVFSLTVSNGKLTSPAASVTVTAAAANVAPVANAGAAQNVLLGASVALSAAASSDANGDALTYAWSFVSRPAGSNAALNSATLVNPVFVADVAGSYVVGLTANDGQLTSAMVSVTVTAAAANVAPVANPGAAQSVTVASTVALNGAASSDANGDTLTYAWTFVSRPAGSAAALSGASAVAPSFVADVAGSYVVALTVSDGRLSSTSSNVTITASAATTSGNAGAVSTLAGLAGTIGSTDGLGAAARFSSPYDVAADAAGNLYVTDQANQTIRKVTPQGAVTTLAGQVGASGNCSIVSCDGTGAVAHFRDPKGIAIDAAGNLYVANTGFNNLRKITPDGVVTTLAGPTGPSFPNGSADGVGAAATFGTIGGVTTDTAGNVYVTESDNNTIRKITPQGVVSTLAGTAGKLGAIDGVGSAARFFGPTGIVADRAGNLYVVDRSNFVIRKVTPAGVVSTFAGQAGGLGTADGSATDARFSFPWGITIDAAGNLYVSDTNYHNIRKITPAGDVSTFAGPTGAIPTSGAIDASGTSARFRIPRGLTVDSAGNIYVTDTGNNAVRKIR